MENLKIYESIARRSQGDIYIGVVGPARVGKSSFIKRFMDLLVVPNITDVYERARVLDEMPQSGSGRTITTTEPKFVPAKAVTLDLPGNMTCRVRLVDCVGYLVPDALGHMEDGKMRMVGTPWDEEKIPFEEAAEKGTRKVIEEHSNVGIVITTDGTTTDLPRENYREAEQRVIRQLQQLHKPFVVLVNSTNPNDTATQRLVETLKSSYGVAAMAVDCVKMTGEQLNRIMQHLLYQFPIDELAFSLPLYLEGLEMDHWLKQQLMETMCNWASSINTAENLQQMQQMLIDGETIQNVRIEDMDLGTGKAVLDVILADDLFYKIVGEQLGQEIENDAQFFHLLRELAEAKQSYDKIRDALEQVEATEYGIVQPKLEEMVLDRPELFQQGDKYGVRIQATAPSMHIIRTLITTEVSPLVGSQQHAEELLAQLLTQFESEPQKIWETNIFGKTVYDMTAEQMQSKLSGVPEHIRVKVQRSLQKICDNGKEYFICIIV